MTDCVFIYTLQYECNSNFNYNEQWNERIDFDSNILRESNQTQYQGYWF